MTTAVDTNTFSYPERPTTFASAITDEAYLVWLEDQNILVNTRPIKDLIEPYMRNWLTCIYPKHIFEERIVELKWGGHHEFDAVSGDGSVVAAFLSNRAKTKGHKENTGGVRKAECDLLRFHGLGREIRKIMVFTDTDFRDLIVRRTTGLGIETIETLVCELSPYLKKKLDSILDRASQEQRAEK